MVDAEGHVIYREVPCGHCLACKIDRTKAWGLRLMLESLCHEDSVFITLTYDPEHVRKVSVCEGSQVLFDTLYKPDLQRFFKRFRKRLGDRKIKYYAVGEYGSRTFRPHYHAIIFGASTLDRTLIEESWPFGYVDCGDVTIQSCNYVSGYIQKKLYGDVADEQYGTRQFPFSCMSKGLGASYFVDHKAEIISDGFISYHGTKLPIPRYFWRLMQKEGFMTDWECKEVSHVRQVDAMKQEKIRYARRGIFDDSLRDSFKERERKARAAILEKLQDFKERDFT